MFTHISMCVLRCVGLCVYMHVDVSICALIIYYYMHASVFRKNQILAYERYSLAYIALIRHPEGPLCFLAILKQKILS